MRTQIQEYVSGKNTGYTPKISMEVKQNTLNHEDVRKLLDQDLNSEMIWDGLGG